MSSKKVNFMISIGLDTTEIIKSYFNAYLEFDNIEYFIVAHELTRIAFEEEQIKTEKKQYEGE